MLLIYWKRITHHFLLMGFIFVIAIINMLTGEEASAKLPGFSAIEAPLISFEEAQKFFQKQKTNQNFPLTVPQLRGSTDVGSEIRELAKSLNNDPDLIHQYVHSNIEYVPMFGSLKGATGALLDKQGNAFDQSSLMIALLRESGFLAKFVFGFIQVDRFTNWLGIKNDALAIKRLLGIAAIPADVLPYPSGNPDGTVDAVVMAHVWVSVNIDGTNYVFDPSFKTYTESPPLDIATAINYDQASFLSNALSGATSTNTYVQHINRDAIADALSEYASQLEAHLSDNYPDARADDILSGRTLQKFNGKLRQTALPHQYVVRDIWNELPPYTQTFLRIQHLGIDVTLSSCDIYGKRLTLFYNSANRPVLRLDGSILATGTTTASSGSYQNLTLSVDHPYASDNGSYGDIDHTMRIKAGGSYLLVNGWGETNQALVKKHQTQANELLQAGQSEMAEPVLGELLAQIGFSWLAQTSRVDQLSDSMFGTFTFTHHMLGICGQTESAYIDMPLGTKSFISDDSDSTKRKALEAARFFSSGGHSSAFEWGVIEQSQPFSAVSTVKLMDIASEQSHKIFETTGANYGIVKPQLKNYSSSDLATLQAYLNAGYRVLLPEYGNVGEGQWAGMGFLSINQAGNFIGYMISGGLKGGYSTENGMLVLHGQVSDYSLSHPVFNDPIDAVTGDYLYNHSDLSIGSSVFPLGLSFERSYNSAFRTIDGPLGLGWSHNFDISLQRQSDGFQGLGEDSSIDAAAALVELYVVTDLLQGEKSKERLLVATLSQRWFMDQLINNVARLKTPGQTEQLVQLQNGSYHAAPGNTHVLTREVDNSYRLTSRSKDVLNFDAVGRLRSWHDANDNAVNFTYQAEKLHTVSNSAGRSFTLNYDGDHIATITDDAGRQISYEYDNANNLIAYINPNGDKTTFAYDLPGRLVQFFYPANPSQPFVTNTYDAQGKIATQTDANGNRYEYEFSEYFSTETDPLGNTHRYVFNEHGDVEISENKKGAVTRFMYDEQQRLNQKVFPEGDRLEYTYDAQHKLRQAKYVPKPGFFDAPLVSEFEYDPAFGKPTAISEPGGGNLTLRYDSKGNLIEHSGQMPTTAFTHNSRGQIETVTNAEGSVTRYVYDNTTADLISILIDESGIGAEYRLGYDRVGNVTRMIDPLNREISFEYDDMRRLIRVSAPLGQEMLYSYDSNGNRIQVQHGPQVTTAAYTFSDKIASVSDPEGDTTHYQYDRLDRLFKVVNAENQTSTYLYDAQGQIEQVIDAMGHIREAYTYTPNGQEQSLTDAKHNTTRYEYDGFDRLRKTVYPDGSYEALSYNAAGDLMQKHTRAGETLGYTYNAFGQLSSRTLPNQSFSYAYNLIGKLTASTDSSGTTQYAYDSAGRLTSQAMPDDKIIAYEYDLVGNRTKLTYPDGYAVSYTYDALDRLTNIIEQGGASLAAYSYDSLSRRERLEYGNGVITNYNYEIDNDLSSLSHRFHDGEVTFGYTYNAISNRTGMSVSDERFLFRPQTDTNDSYASNNLNQYTEVNSVSFEYDGNGNLSWDGVNRYSYNAENRLISTVTPQHSANYRYDAFNRRSVKTVDDEGISYLYDGNQVLAEYDVDGQMLRRYVYGPGIDEPIILETSGKTYYYSVDGLGSVVSLTDNLGILAETYSYSPFGEQDSGSTLGNSYFYTSRRYDTESELYYYRTRHYNQALGRFLQPDPIGYKGGINLYAYVLNNSVNYVDPLGLDPHNWGGPVGAPSFWESLIPVWGSGRAAINDFQEGRWGWGVVNTAVAVSDIFLVKSIVTGIAKGAIKVTGSFSWSAVRRWYGIKGFAVAGQHVHHWLIPQRTWGSSVPNWFKNQPWNLMPMKSPLWHRSIEGKGTQAFNALGRFWHGTPSWVKSFPISTIGHYILGGRYARK